MRKDTQFAKLRKQLKAHKFGRTWDEVALLPEYAKLQKVSKSPTTLLYKICQYGHRPRKPAICVALGLTHKRQYEVCPVCERPLVSGRPHQHAAAKRQLNATVSEDLYQAVVADSHAQGISTAEWVRKVAKVALTLDKRL